MKKNTGNKYVLLLLLLPALMVLAASGAHASARTLEARQNRLNIEMREAIEALGLLAETFRLNGFVEGSHRLFFKNIGLVLHKLEASSMPALSDELHRAGASKDARAGENHLKRAQQLSNQILNEMNGMLRMAGQRRELLALAFKLKEVAEEQHTVTEMTELLSDNIPPAGTPQTDVIRLVAGKTALGQERVQKRLVQLQKDLWQMAEDMKRGGLDDAASALTGALKALNGSADGRSVVAEMEAVCNLLVRPVADRLARARKGQAAIESALRAAQKQLANVVGDEETMQQQLVMQMIDQLLRDQQDVQGKMSSGDEAAARELAMKQADLAQKLAEMNAGFLEDAAEGDSLAEEMISALAHMERAQGHLEQEKSQTRQAAQEMAEAVQGLNQARKKLARAMASKKNPTGSNAAAEKGAEHPPVDLSLAEQPPTDEPPAYAPQVTAGTGEAALVRLRRENTPGAEVKKGASWQARFHKRVQRDIGSSSSVPMPEEYKQLLQQYTDSL